LPGIGDEEFEVDTEIADFLTETLVEVRVSEFFETHIDIRLKMNLASTMPIAMKINIHSGMDTLRTHAMPSTIG